jgi:AsmA family protein
MATQAAGSRALKWTGIAAAAVLGSSLLGIFILQQADLRGPVERMIAARTGAPARITGELRLRLVSLTPTATATGLELSNPARSGGGKMASIEKLTVELRLLSLFTGDIVLPRLLIERPDLLFIRDASGRTNWPTRKDARRTGRARALPIVHDLVVTRGRVRIVDRVRDLTLSGSLSASEVVSLEGSPTMRVASHGELNGRPFRLLLHGGTLAKLRRDRPYPFHLELTAGGTRMTSLGTLARPFDLAGYQAGIAVEGEDIADLFYLTGLVLPNTPPYELTGHVHRTGSRMYLREFAGVVGDSDIRTDATIELAGDRPLVMAEVSSESLDLDDLGVPLGAAPSVREGETASPAQRAEAQAMRAKRRLFPDAKLQLNRLRAIDAYVQFHASAVKARKVPLREVSFHLQLDDGVLTLDPVSFLMREGKLSGTARIDARQDLPKSTLDARLTGLQLGQFRPRNAEQAPFEGALLGRAQVHGYGSSIHEFASTADGEVTVVLPSGSVRDAFAELTGINVARGLGLLLRDDEDQTAVRCGVAGFAVKHGTLHATNLVFDTEHVLISGGGQIDLEREAYDLSIKGQPKKFRIFRLRSPIAIRGPLRKPDIGLESGDSLKQTGVAAALAAAVAPLAAVLAFVDPGLADDANCAGLLAEAKRDGAPVKTADVKAAERG